MKTFYLQKLNMASSNSHPDSILYILYISIYIRMQIYALILSMRSLLYIYIYVHV